MGPAATPGQKGAAHQALEAILLRPQGQWAGQGWAGTAWVARASAAATGAPAKLAAVGQNQARGAGRAAADRETGGGPPSHQQIQATESSPRTGAEHLEAAETSGRPT
jgi:hypothetical protein